jgi:cobalt-zinc-cadmium efflux system membrane fusion protein
MGFLSRALTLSSAMLVSTGWASHEIAITVEQMQHLGINLSPVEEAASVMTDRLPGRVVIPPHQERVVSTPNAGLVTSLAAAQGDRVEAGQVLARIESSELVALQREFLQASTDVRLAAAELRRDQQLFKEGIIAERRYLETRSRHEQATAVLDERRQGLLLAGMSTEEIQSLEDGRRLTSTLEVRAPMAGVVVGAMALVGQRVDRAEPLYRVAQLEPLWLEVRAPVDRLKGVQAGGTVEIPCEHGEARISLIGSNVDPTNQTVLVRVQAVGSGDCLRPGQFVQVRLQLAGVERQFRIPASAVVRAGENVVAFVHEPYGFTVRAVQVVARQDGYTIVTGSLSKGEQVAVSGIAALKSIWSGKAE